MKSATSSKSMSEESNDDDDDVVVVCAAADKTTNDSNSKIIIPPPIAHREEDRVVYIGAAPEGWDVEKYPRQAEDSTEELIDPPYALSDPYGWLRDESRENSDVIQYLEKENLYTKQMTDHLESLRNTLYDEFLSHIKETSYSLPHYITGGEGGTRNKEWLYYTRMYEGKSYEVYCRAPPPPSSNDNDIIMTESTIDWDGSAESNILPNEEVLLDVNELGKEKEYCVVSEVELSPSHKLLAYSVDFVGGEEYSIYLRKNLSYHHKYDINDDAEESVVENTDGTIVWHTNDDDTFYYIRLDDSLRPYQVYRHTISSDEDDTLIYEESDEMFWLSIYKTTDEKYLFIDSQSTESSEIHYIKLYSGEEDTTSLLSLKCIAKRRKNVLYHVDHRHGKWWIQSNVGSLSNYALFTAPAIENSEEYWNLSKDATSVLFNGSNNERSLDDITCFDSHVVVTGREDGLPRIWFIHIDDINDQDKNNNNHTECHAVPTTIAISKFERLEFKEEAFDVSLSGINYDFYSKRVIITYDSLVTPTQQISISLDNSKDRIIVKERDVPGYDKALYESKRIMVTSRDEKTKIPVDVLYRKDKVSKDFHEVLVSSSDISSKRQEGRQLPTYPVHLYAYGAYGSCEEAEFSSSVLPFLDRGIIYVVAHVRGGGEMGRTWYEEPNGGKYLCKKNTFNDFVDVARWLIEDRRITSSEVLSVEGRSAGGLTVSAAINQAPDLFRVAILGVPAVDVMASMSDSSINLVIAEWEEWGNPNEVKYFQYMKDYSPMNNVNTTDKNTLYPAYLVTGGLHDPRVQFWEPAKFVATLRHHINSSSSKGPICLKMEMSAGHFSASDRYKYWKELAFDYAFLLDQLQLGH